MKFQAYTRAFKIDLMSCFIGLILFTIAIVFYSYHVNSKHTVTLAKDLVGNAINHALTETNQYLKMADDRPGLGAVSFSDADFNLLQDKKIEPYLIEVLKRSPFLVMAYLADDNGNIITCYRNKNKSISTQIINKEAEEPYVLWKFRDDVGDVYDTKKEFHTSYDARDRKWYSQVKTDLQSHWSEIYHFYADDLDDMLKPTDKETSFYGLSVANPIMDEKNNFLGVLSVDISLNQLSGFLSSLKIGKNGKVFVVNDERELIIYPDIESQQLYQKEKLKIDAIGTGWVKEGIQEFFKKYDTEFSYYHDEHKYYIQVSDLSKNTTKNWYLVIIVPIDDFLGQIKQTHFLNMSVTMGMLFLSLLLAWWISHNLSRPIENMTKIMRKITALDFSDINLASSPIKEFRQMSTEMGTMIHALNAFSKYVPHSLVKDVVKNGQEVELGGNEVNLSIFFSDIEGFTEITEETAPMELLNDLSHYFDQLSKVIMLENKGTVDKYIGDSVMAFWGAPQQNLNHAKDACHAALGCQRVINKINIDRANSNKELFNTRIGIHTGIAIVGNIGSSDRFNYTIIGDNVNLASRIEGLNKRYQSNIIVSQTTYRQVYQHFVFRPLDFVMVKGKNEGIKIYELIAEKDKCDKETLALVDLATRAFQCYLAKEFTQAIKLYKKILADNPDDRPATLMLKKCEKFNNQKPDENWTGATRLFEK